MVRHHNHGLAAKSQPLALHGSRNHLKGLAAAYLMCQKRIAAIQDVGDGIFLMLPQRNLRTHAAEADVRTIVLPRAGGVEFLVIEFDQRLPPLRVFPNPVPECILDSLLFLLCQCGFLLVQHTPLLAIGFCDNIIHTGIPQVQRILQNLIGIDSGCAVGGARIHIPVADILLAGNTPLSCVGRVIHDNGTPEIERRLEQIFHELLNILFVNPGCTEAYINFGGIQIFGLRLFQSLHIVPEHFGFLSGMTGNGQLLPHIT